MSVNHSTALFVMACNSVMRCLLSVGADVHISLLSSEACCVEPVQLMLNAGAHVNAMNSKGNTPLHAAASHGSVDVTMTLMLATKKGYDSVLQLLISAHANIEKVDDMGKSTEALYTRDTRCSLRYPRGQRSIRDVADVINAPRSCKRCGTVLIVY